jgi:hypothetical protein
MSTNSEKVLLKATDSDKSKQFDKDHADRILAIPGTKWKLASEEAPVKPAKSAPALDAAKDAEASGEAEAAPAVRRRS